jgi:hypothetical protein
MEEASKQWTNVRIERQTRERLGRLLEPSGRNLATAIDLLSISWERTFRGGMTDAERARYDDGKMTLKEMRETYERIFHDGGTPRRRSLPPPPLGSDDDEHDDERVADLVA